MSVVLNEVKSRGYWEFKLHPKTFEENRVSNILDLCGFVQRSSVDLRGWGFPQFNPTKKPRIKTNFIEYDVDHEHHREFWRMYQTGLFYMVRGITDDWRDRSSFYPAYDGWTPKQQIGIMNIIGTCTDFTEFASRLSGTEAGDSEIILELNFYGYEGRKLFADGENLMVASTLDFNTDFFPQKLNISKAELKTNSAQIGLNLGVEILRRFQLDPSDQLIEGIKSNLKIFNQ